MDLTLERPGEHLFIRSVGPEGIRVVDEIYSGPIVLSATDIVTDWPIRSFEELDEAHLEPLLRLEPEIVILGTGAKQVFLPPEKMMWFYGRGLGLEVMTTAAACRTFNILVADTRRVVAAMLPVA
jgi:uncharacterized protein